MRLSVTPLETDGPVAQRQRRHPYKVTIGGSSPPRTTFAQVRQSGRAARLGHRRAALVEGRCARLDTGACNLRVVAGSTRSHKPGQPGATPGPATYMAGYANWHSGEVESLVPVGSSPTSVTDRTIPWSNGEDAWVTTRKVMVQLHPGSLYEEWSVGVLAAHLRGKEEDPVQLRDGPLESMGWHVPRRRLILARSVWRVRLLVRSTE